jgi:hypothetical protein
MKKFAFILTILASSSALAQGPISKDEVIRGICSESPILCRVVSDLNLAEEGYAARSGRSGENAKMPYFFSASGGRSHVIIDRNTTGRLSVTIQ